MCISTGRLDAEIDDEALVVFLAKICQRGRLKFLFCVGLIFAFHMFNNKLHRDTCHKGHKSYPKLWHVGPTGVVWRCYFWMLKMLRESEASIRYLQLLMDDLFAHVVEVLSRGLKMNISRFKCDLIWRIKSVISGFVACFAGCYCCCCCCLW